MEALLILLGGGLVAIALGSLLVRAHAPSGSPRGGSSSGLRSAREIVEHREERDAEDLAQMLELHNRRRRRRGEAERTVEDIELIVAAGVRDQQRRREAAAAERELDQLLDATNARRRARGLPERTREDVRRDYGSGAAAR